MRRPLFIHCLLALSLLLQGFGGAWAASQMAAGSLQVAGQLADLPPCHQTAATKAQFAKSTKGRCCGAAGCHCVVSCGGLPAVSAAARGALLPPQVELLVEQAQAALQSGHYGPPLRPPAPLPG